MDTPVAGARARGQPCCGGLCRVPVAASLLPVGSPVCSIIAGVCADVTRCLPGRVGHNGFLLRIFCDTVQAMTTKRNPRPPRLNDRWMMKVRNPDGSTKSVRSASWGKGSRWQVCWVDDSGAERRETQFATKAEAEERAKELTADIHRGDYIDRHKGSVPFGTVAEAWFLTKSHIAPKTLAGYRSIMDTLTLPRWGSVPVKDIDFEAYSQWIGSLSVDGSQKGEPLSASRIIQAHQNVGAILKYAQRTGKVGRNVALEMKRSVDLPQPVDSEHRYLTHAELLTLAGYMGRFETLTLVLGYCGLRFGEAAPLRRKHVNLEDRMLTVARSATYVTGRGIVDNPKTKTKRNRTVPVPAPIWERLKAELPPGADDLLFPRQRGGVLPLEEYRRVFDKACVEAKIEGLTPKGLRHTCASLAIKSGANIKVLQRMLGHATASMTLDRYGHMYKDDLDEVARKLGQAMETTAESLRNTKAKRGRRELPATA